MAGELAECITLFASLYCGIRTFQKTSLFFGSYFPIALQTKISLPGGQARSRADNRFWMVIFWFDPVNMPGSIWRNIGLLKNERIVDQNVPLTNWMKLSGKGAGNQEKMFVTGEIQNRAVFLEVSRFLNPSVPYLGLLFPSLPPPS